jgi:NADPH2:quinone reductase
VRAVRYRDHGPADVLEVDEVARPDPAVDEVLVDVRAASVNPVDAMIRAGEYGDVGLPAVPGGDGAGVVAAVGDRVDRVAVGDRVFASGLDRATGGTYAEYATVPASKLASLPESCDFEAGAAVANVGATAWTALTAVAGVRPGDRVLVHGGAGGVGHVAVQIAASAGADVVATAGSETGRRRTRDLGAVAAFDYDSDALAEDVLAATDGAGVDVVLDHHLEANFETDLAAAARGADVVALMGHVPSVDARPFYGREVTVHALRMDNHAARAPMLQRVRRLLASGDLTPVVADTYDLEETPRAHRDVVTGGYVGKLVVTP